MLILCDMLQVCTYRFRFFTRGSWSSVARGHRGFLRCVNDLTRTRRRAVTRRDAGQGTRPFLLLLGKFKALSKAPGTQRFTDVVLREAVTAQSEVTWVGESQNRGAGPASPPMSATRT